MSNLLTQRLPELVGKKILIFMHNRFRYEGKLLAVDECFLELYDSRTLKRRFLKCFDVAEVEELE